MNGTNDSNIVRLIPKRIAVNTQDKEFLEEFLASVEKNLSDSDFDIDTLCDDLTISRSTLFRRISDIIGGTPMQFIQSYRLERAAQLLEDNFGNVTEVAEAVGFSDPFHFSRCFKEKFRQSPKAYQLSHLKKDAGGFLVEKGKDNMNNNSPTSPESHAEFALKELDRELIVRVALMQAGQIFNFSHKLETSQRDELFTWMKELYQFHQIHELASTVNEGLKYFSTQELEQKIKLLIEDAKLEKDRMDFYSLDCLDFYDINDDRLRRSAGAVAAVCMNADLIPDGKSYSKLRVAPYGKTFKLCETERFYSQPVGTGRMCSGVLVTEDMIVTAAHFAHEENVGHLRFVFDFVMEDPVSPVSEIPNDKIYKGVEIIHRVHNPAGDWALVKLDRKVRDREVATLSAKDISTEQPVYVIGHPCGLPLKYAPGSSVRQVSGSYFRADLDVYGSSSGSPVFCATSHRVIGIVSRAKPTDFRWTENGWITVRYQKDHSYFSHAQCSRVSEFRGIISK